MLVCCALLCFVCFYHAGACVFPMHLARIFRIHEGNVYAPATATEDSKGARSLYLLE